MESDIIIDQDLDSNIGGSTPTGFDALFQTRGVLNAIRQRAIRLLVPNLTLGVVQSATSSTKLAPVLINAVQLTDLTYALKVSPTAGATVLTASAPTAASVGVASAAAVTANTSRKGLVLTNTSSNNISIAYGAAAVLNSGITLLPNGGTFVMDATTFSTAEIRAIAGGAASNLAVQEFT